MASASTVITMAPLLRLSFHVHPPRHWQPDHDYVDHGYLQHNILDHGYFNLTLGYLDIGTNSYRLA